MSKLVKVYDYIDRNGKLLHQTCRYEPKDFRQRQPDPLFVGGFIDSLVGVELVLYNLPNVIAAIASGQRVYLAEGEKDADTLLRLGVTATCNALGAGKWKDNYTDALAGADVVMFPHKDTAGRAHAEKVMAALDGKAKSLVIVELPDRNGISVNDVTDWTEAGGTLPELLGIVASAPAWTPPSNPPPAPVAPTVPITGVCPYAAKALQNECARMAATLDGDRGNQLNRSAYSLGQLVGGGELPRALVEEKLFEASQQCSPPMEDARARNTIQSGLTAGMKKPRHAPLTDVIFGTDAWLAKNLAERYENQIHWVQDWEKWVVWDDHRWSEDSLRVEWLAKLLVRDLIRESSQGMKSTDPDVVKKATKMFAVAREYSQYHKLRSAVASTRSEPGIALEVELLNIAPALLNCPNGTVNLKTGEAMDCNPHMLLTQSTKVEYDPRVHSLVWDKFVREVVPDDAVRDWLQRFCGHAITGLVREHLLAICTGCGSNGKSTFWQSLFDAIGDYASAAPPSLLVGHGNERHPTELASLYKRRLVISAESPEGGKLTENLVKMLTGGDRIEARRMQEDFWGFSPTHQLLLYTNHRPRVKGTDEGIWRRIRILPFDVSITGSKIDPMLKEKIAAERQGVLTWLVHGAIEYFKRGMSDVPDIVRIATEEYRKDEDFFMEFIDNCLVKVAGTQMPGEEVRTLYEQWRAARSAPRMSAKAITSAMEGHGFRRFRGRDSNGFVNVQTKKPTT